MNTSMAEKQVLAAKKNLYRKVTLRIVPFLFLCYFVSFLDRINIGFAHLQMSSDLGITEATYGLGAGVYFVGYVLFEVPSNILLARIGARLTFSRIMIAWGIISAAMMFVQHPWQLYGLRFLLGMFEAGFFPGLVVYLTYWFPAAHRATVLSWFIAGASLAGMLGGPLSGWIMRDFNGIAGLHGWQWLFVAEGLPATLLGFAAYFILVDQPAHVRWLDPDEKALLLDEIEAERKEKQTKSIDSLREVFSSARIYLCVFVYFTVTCGAYALNFWLPVLIRNSGVKDVFTIGLYSAVPYFIAAIGTVLISCSSDRTRERRFHFVICAMIGALALALLGGTANGSFATLAMLSVALAFVFGGSVVFWSIPPMFLTGTAAAAGIALVSSLGSLGGFISPYVIGLVATRTGKVGDGLYVMAALTLLGGLCVLAALPPSNKLKARTTTH